MAVRIRPPAEADVLAMYRADGTAFGSQWKPEDIERTRPTIELDRFRIAVDGDDVVGTAGSFGLEMTVPGGSTLPTGGVTWVSCAVTHRRQGVLRSLMQAIHDDIDARDEPLAALGASEGGIYERFGVRGGVRAAGHRDRPPARPAATRVPAGVQAQCASSTRTRRSRSSCRVGIGHAALDRERSTATRRGCGCSSPRSPTPRTFAVHDDGFAMWKTEPQWHMGHPAHEVWLHDLAAATPEAHAALWHTLLSLDLTGPIRSLVVPVDDPLPYLLTDRRALRTTVVNDGLWLNLPRRQALLRGSDVRHRRRHRRGGRRRPMADRRRRLRGCAAAPTCSTDHASLSALLLGGVRPSALVAGRRMTARNADVLRRADALFATAPEPYCQTGF